MRAWIAVLLAWLWSAMPGAADTRVALVIGNSAYAGVGALSNPTGDAALVADALGSEGFKVTLVRDATRTAMLKALQAFSDEADQADWALVYYAGHGIEVGGVNYLLPIDVELRSDRDAQDEAISLNRVLETVENARKLRLVILDACRNNPFAATMKRSICIRAVERGLAPPEPQAGVIVVYAAAAGEVAEDGAGDHSPFAAALARRMQEPGLEVTRLFNVVTADVLDATGHRQRPYQYGSNPSREEFYFKSPAPVVAKPVDPSAFERTWRFLATSTDPGALKAFLDSLPEDSPLRRRVEARIAELPEPAPQVANQAPEPPKPAPTTGSAERRYVLPEGAAVVPQLGHTGSVEAVAFSPDGRFIVSGSRDETLKVWDAASGALLRTFEGHVGPVSSVAFSPDGRFIVSGSMDHTLKLWDASTVALLKTFNGHNGLVFSVAFSPDGRFIVSGSDDHTLKLWDAASGALLKSAMLSTFVEDEVSSVAFSSDGRYIVSAFSRDGRAFAIHSGTWDNIVEMGEMGASTPASPPRKSPIGYRNSVSSVAFSSDGRLIVIGSGDNTLKLQDAKSGALLKTFEGHHDSVSSVAFSPNGRLIVSGSMDHTLKLWDASTGGLLATYFVVDGHGVAYTPDDRFVTDGDPHAAFAICAALSNCPWTTSSPLTVAPRSRTTLRGCRRRRLRNSGWEPSAFDRALSVIARSPCGRSNPGAA